MPATLSLGFDTVTMMLLHCLQYLGISLGSGRFQVQEIISQLGLLCFKDGECLSVSTSCVNSIDFKQFLLFFRLILSHVSIWKRPR